MAICDERLSAYLDNELSVADSAAVRDALETSPELRSRLELLKRANRKAAAFFSEIDRHPLPNGVLEALGLADQGARKASAEGNVTPFRPRQQVSAFPWSLPLAASVALLVGFGMAQLAPLRNDTDRYQMAMKELSTGVIHTDNPVFNILEYTASGQAVEIADLSGMIAKPILTFQTKDGGFCREIALEGAQSASRSVACRVSPGEWRVQTMIALPVEDGGRYQVAGDAATQAFDQTIRAMMASLPFGEAGEATLIENNWQPQD